MVVEASVGPPPATAVDGPGRESSDLGTPSVDVAVRRNTDAVPADAGRVGDGQEEEVAVLLLVVAGEAVAVRVAQDHWQF